MKNIQPSLEKILLFDDENLTQAHVDLATNRLIMNSNGNFLRWLSNDKF